MGYDIYIANKDKSLVLKLPIIPPELPELSYSIQNEEFRTYNDGSYNFIKEQGLYTFTLDSWLPVKKYPFAKSDILADQVLSLIDYAIKTKDYIQIVIIKDDGTTYVNNKFSIENFRYSVKRNKDYNYSLEVKQYRPANKEVYQLGWNKNATGWWFCYDYDNYKYYTNGWQFLQEEWYYFNENGYALESQWLLYKNNWYYLDENCKMVHDSWKKINGVWYYLGEQGVMYANRQTPDGYYVNSTGAWEG